MLRNLVLSIFCISSLFFNNLRAEDKTSAVDLNEHGIPNNINSIYVSSENGGKLSNDTFNKIVELKKYDNINFDKALLLAFDTIDQKDAIYGIYGVFSYYKKNLLYTSYTNYHIIKKLLNMVMEKKSNIHLFYNNDNDNIIQIESKRGNLYNISYKKDETSEKYSINILNDKNEMLCSIPIVEDNNFSVDFKNINFPHNDDVKGVDNESLVTNTINIPFDNEINKNYPQYVSSVEDEKKDKDDKTKNEKKDTNNSGQTIINQYIYNDGLYLIFDLINHVKKQKNIISFYGLYTLNLEPISSFTDYNNYFLKAENYNDIFNNKTRFILSYEKNNDNGEDINVNGIDLKTIRLMDISTDDGSFFSIYWTPVPLITVNKDGVFIFHYAGYLFDNKNNKIIYSQVDMNDN